MVVLVIKSYLCVCTCVCQSFSEKKFTTADIDPGPSFAYHHLRGSLEYAAKNPLPKNYQIVDIDLMNFDQGLLKFFFIRVRIFFLNYFYCH